MARRSYSAAFKREAVALVQAGHPVESVAAQLGMPNGTLWNWVYRGPNAPAAQGARSSSPTSTPAHEVIDPAAHQAALRRIAELERENEFLGKASAYFAQKVHP